MLRLARSTAWLMQGGRLHNQKKFVLSEKGWFASCKECGCCCKRETPANLTVQLEWELNWFAIRTEYGF